MKKINSADLKQKLARTIKTSMSIRNNANQLEVHVSGPFQNSKSGKSHWIVVFGDNGQTWLIKPEFVIDRNCNVLPKPSNIHSRRMVLLHGGGADDNGRQMTGRHSSKMNESGL